MTKQETNDEKNELEKLIKVVEYSFEAKSYKIIRRNIAYFIVTIFNLSFLSFLAVYVVYGLAPHFGELGLESRFATILSEVALVVSFMSFAYRIPETPIRRETTYQEHVDLNYKKKKSEVEEGQRPLLKALIMMKCKQPDFSLKDIYDMNNSLFNEKRLLNKLYE